MPLERSKVTAALGGGRNPHRRVAERGYAAESVGGFIGNANYASAAENGKGRLESGITTYIDQAPRRGAIVGDKHQSTGNKIKSKFFIGLHGRYAAVWLCGTANPRQLRNECEIFFP